MRGGVRGRDDRRLDPSREPECGRFVDQPSRMQATPAATGLPVVSFLAAGAAALARYANSERRRRPRGTSVPARPSGLGNEVGRALPRVSCTPPVGFWRRGIARVAAAFDSASVTATPPRGAMGHTQYAQSIPPHRHERALRTKDRCGRPPSYQAACAVTAPIWGMERAGSRRGIDERSNPTCSVNRQRHHTVPPLRRVMTNRVKASRASW